MKIINKSIKFYLLIYIGYYLSVIKKDYFLNYKIKDQLLRYLMSCQKDIVQEKVVIQEF